MKYESKMDASKEAKVDGQIEDANDHAQMDDLGRAAHEVTRQSYFKLHGHHTELWGELSEGARDYWTHIAQSVLSVARQKGLL